MSGAGPIRPRLLATQDRLPILLAVLGGWHGLRSSPPPGCARHSPSWGHQCGGASGLSSPMTAASCGGDGDLAAAGRRPVRHGAADDVAGHGGSAQRRGTGELHRLPLQQPDLEDDEEHHWALNDFLPAGVSRRDFTHLTPLELEIDGAVVDQLPRRSGLILSTPTGFHGLCPGGRWSDPASGHRRHRGGSDLSR